MWWWTTCRMASLTGWKSENLGRHRTRSSCITALLLVRRRCVAVNGASGPTRSTVDEVDDVRLNSSSEGVLEGPRPGNVARESTISLCETLCTSNSIRRRPTSSIPGHVSNACDTRSCTSRSGPVLRQRLTWRECFEACRPEWRGRQGVQGEGATGEDAETGRIVCPA